MNVPFRYDPEADAGYLALSQQPVARTVDLEGGPLGLPVLVDLDEAGAIVGIELLSVTATAPGLLLGDSEEREQLSD